jgi:DNA-binding transcriptional LysR family regulator
MDMQMQQLAYVVALAETGHFTQAAAQLRVAQPTLSKQIRVLEAELGTPLFERGRGGTTLTQAGELLVPLARRILSDAQTARRQVRELAGLQRGRLRLGATPSLMTGLLAEALTEFRAELPDIELQVQESGSQDLVRRLLDGDLDMALLIASSKTRDATLTSTPILREDLVVVSSTDLPPPTTSGSMPVAALRHHQLVMFREGYDLRTVTLAACRAAGFEPQLAIEGGEMDAVLRFVEAGLGLAVVPSMVLQTRQRLRKTTLTQPRLQRAVVLAHRARVAPPPAAVAFRLALMAHLEQLSSRGRSEHLEVLPVRTRLDLLDVPQAAAEASSR